VTVTKAQRVYDYLASHPPATRTEIASALGLTRAQVRRAIAQLIDYCAIDPERSERVYRLAKAAPRPRGHSVQMRQNVKQ
jgi:DNA-binding IclR family transcriptional regulator